MEKAPHAPSQDTDRKEGHDELHRRFRNVSDQLERYAERDKQSLVSSTTFRDEYDDLREEATLQRRKMVSLEERLREKEEAYTQLQTKLEEERAREEGKNGGKGEASGKRGVEGGGSTASNGGADVNCGLKELADRRLKELEEMHVENKRLSSEVEGLRAELTRIDCNVIPLKTILQTAMYQMMEGTLQQLYLKEKNWGMEREAQVEELEAERKDAAERLEQANGASEKTIEDLRRQLEEMRRVADAAKVEKDKVVMTYESRKMEAGNAATVIAAAEKRAGVSDEMRQKAEKANGELTKTVEGLRTRVREMENELKDSCKMVSFFVFVCVWCYCERQPVGILTHVECDITGGLEKNDGATSTGSRRRKVEIDGVHPRSGIALQYVWRSGRREQATCKSAG